MDFNASNKTLCAYSAICIVLLLTIADHVGCEHGYVDSSKLCSYSMRGNLVLLHSRKPRPEKKPHYRHLISSNVLSFT